MQIQSNLWLSGAVDGMISTVSDPKLHHYVPQFYLRRFADEEGNLWVWDRGADKTFRARPRAIAAESYFYHHDELEAHGHDPLAMEKQFAELEGEVALISGDILEQVRAGERGSSISISGEVRQQLSLFVVLQFLRTAESREVLARFVEEKSGAELGQDERRLLHLDLLWDEQLIERLALRVSESALTAIRTLATPDCGDGASTPPKRVMCCVTPPPMDDRSSHARSVVARGR